MWVFYIIFITIISFRLPVIVRTIFLTNWKIIYVTRILKRYFVTFLFSASFPLSDVSGLCQSNENSKNKTPTLPHPRMLGCVTQKCFNVYMLDRICYRVQMLCFSYTAYPLPVKVCWICFFDNFEKLSMLVGFSRDLLEGWARGCCVHVILVQDLITAYVILMVRGNLYLTLRPYQKVIDKSLGLKVGNLLRQT